MANKMLDRLREKDKRGLFEPTQTSISYPTGFPTFDYRNGYLVQVRDLSETLVTEYPALGLVGGTFITLISKSGVGKTTLAAQLSANIVKNFDNAFVMHYDLEQTLSYTRIKNITKLKQQELLDKYVLKQELNYVEDIFDAIMGIANEKASNKEEYTYETGFRDEFNRPIFAYVPTFIIIDSIPTLASKPDKDKDGRLKIEFEGSTYANRVAKNIAQFYKRLMPILKTFNITVIAINHINQKIEINPMMKTQAQLLYMKTDETMPGGYTA